MAEENKYIKQIKKGLLESSGKKSLQDSFFIQLNRQIPTTQLSDHDLKQLSDNLIQYLVLLYQPSHYLKGQYVKHQNIIDILGKIGRRVQDNNTLDEIL